MPQPFGLLHTKWLKEAESTSPKGCPASCRSRVSVVLLSSNGTHIPARLAIAAHTIGRDTTYAVEVRPPGGAAGSCLPASCCRCHCCRCGRCRPKKRAR